MNMRSPLHDACAKGDERRISFLLASLPRGHVDLLHVSINLFLIKKDGKTPLHCAVENSHINVVKALIQRGADIHSYNSKVFEGLSLF